MANDGAGERAIDSHNGRDLDGADLSSIYGEWMEYDEAWVSFLPTDLELANTFLDVARSTGDAERRLRNIANARNAHDTVKRFAAKLTEPERSRIEQVLAKLKKRLGGFA